MDEPKALIAHPQSAGKLRGILRQTLGYGIAAACLVWVFHDVQHSKILQHMQGIRWNWVLLAVIVDVVSYLGQGLRWRLLLHNVGPVTVLGATEAIYVGLFANEILPMRVGEVIRGYLVSRRLSTKFVRVIPSMAVERLFDGIWLAIGIGLVAVFVRLPRGLAEAGDALGIIILVTAALFIYVLVRKRRPALQSSSEDSPSLKLPSPVRSFFDAIEIELRAIGTSSSFFLAFIVSLVFLLLQVLAFWLVMLAYGLQLSFWVGLAVMVIVHLGTALPNAPANVGTYQFFVVVGLGLFGVDKTFASGFSVVVFLILTLPLLAVGFVALGRSGKTLSAIRNEINGLVAGSASVRES